MNATFYGIRDFADVIKDLEMGDYLRLSGRALNATSVLIRGRQREI